MAKHSSCGAGSVTDAESPESSVPWVNSIFEQPWWLEAVAPGRWRSVVLRQDDRVVARMPFVEGRRFGLRTISQPPLTQTLGPWLAPIEGKYARRLETEKRLLGELIALLPPSDHFRMNCAPALTNWLPFYWAGFRATVNYTYRIDDLTDLDRVQGEFQEHVRRGIKKAASTVEIDHDYPLEDLLRLDARTYARQGLKPPVSADLVRRLDSACAARGARRIFGAVDASGRTHAALFVVWDDRTFYALINARDPDVQTFGSNTLLYWEAIRLAARTSRIFDFEGSMIEPIEHFVRGFGGRQTPYLSLSRTGRKAQAVLALRAARQGLVAARRREPGGR